MASVTGEDGQVDHKHETAEDHSSHLTGKTETDASNNVHVPANDSTATHESLKTSHEVEKASSHHGKDAAVDNDNNSFESQNQSLPTEAKNLLTDALKSPSTATTESPLSNINTNLGAATNVSKPTAVSDDHNKPEHKPKVAEPHANVAHAAPVSSSVPQPESKPKESAQKPPVETPVKPPSAAVQNNEVSSSSGTPNRGHAAVKEEQAKVTSSPIQGKTEVKKVEQPTLTSSRTTEKTGTSKAAKESRRQFLFIGAAAVVALAAIVVFRYSRS